MPERSSNSVKVSYLNGNEILKQLRLAAKRLKQNTNVQQIYLFGSFVKGDFKPGSDADISIILKQDSRRVIDRIPEFMGYFSKVSVPVDIFPYTFDEVEQMKASNNSLLREILSTGVQL